MSLNLGKSKSTQQQSSTSTSGSTSYSASETGQAIAFEDYFRNLYAGASGAAGTAVAGADELSGAARQLFTGGMGFLEGLGGDAGTAYLEERLTGPDDVLTQQLDTLQSRVGRLYTDEFNPATVSAAVAGGTLGGGRQGVAEALDKERAASVFTEGATQLLSANQAQKDAAATTIASNSLQSAATGLGALPGLFDVASSGANAELDIYKTLSSIMGGPTTLTTSSSSSIAKAFSDAFSSGSGGSSAFNLGFGFGG